MNKAFYIIGIIFAVLFMFVIGYYMEEVKSARWRAWDIDFYGDFGSPSYSSFDGGNSPSDLSFQAALLSLIFFLFYAAMDILGLVKVKTKTAKVLSIIGLCFTGLYLLWDLVVLTDPGALAFDDVGGGFVLYTLTMLAFSIVGLVQAIRYGKIKYSAANTAPPFTQNQTTSQKTTAATERDLLDS